MRCVCFQWSWVISVKMLPLNKNTKDLVCGFLVWSCMMRKQGTYAESSSSHWTQNHLNTPKHGLTWKSEEA